VTIETTHAHDLAAFEIGTPTGTTGPTAEGIRAGIAGRQWPFPPIVVLCGSMRFTPEMARENARLTASGHIVLAPVVDMRRPSPLSLDPVGAARMKAHLDELHRAKIRLADEVIVICVFLRLSSCRGVRWMSPQQGTDQRVGVGVTRLGGC